jgi:hypothetical protein
LDSRRKFSELGSGENEVPLINSITCTSIESYESLPDYLFNNQTRVDFWHLSLLGHRNGAVKLTQNSSLVGEEKDDREKRLNRTGYES